MANSVSRSVLSRIRAVLRLVAAGLVLFVFVTPGRAVTCEEARSLSTADLNRYAARLEVTPAYLAALLNHAFCEVPAAAGERATAPERKQPPTRSRTTG